MKRALITSLLIGILCQSGLAQEFDKTKLDLYFDALEANNKFMGSVAVSRNGSIIYSRSTGYADFENKIKADENSRYRIGSISKTFTTVLVMKAVEQNKLALDQTIGKYFPSIKNSGKITIENLLYHRSGIHSFTSDSTYLKWNTQGKTEKEMTEIIARGGIDFEPDTKSEYSNSNFVLLTFILEKTFGKPYAELLQEHIVQPLGLKNTSLGGKINTSNKDCNSYKYLDTWVVEPETDISIPLGAGGIVSTPGDLVKFSDALFGGKLLSSESLEKMKIVKGQYGLGIFNIPFYDKAGYGHTGGIDGFSSVFSYFSDGDVSFAMTCNGSNFNTNNISIAVLSAIFNRPYDIPEFSSIVVSSEELDSYLGVYTSSQIPISITVTRKNNTLIAQGSGQASFPLEPAGKDKFKFDQADLVMEFNPANNTMILTQGGGKFDFKRE
ncbi:MAG: serine hydrolase domain-containing protein [Bacteroidales bacterium]|jgi:CubicO group peptidase (beta-lactamase class C family)|nr:serine hydrolase domain-containing protein [Bacteroidales bacterium]